MTKEEFIVKYGFEEIFEENAPLFGNISFGFDLAWPTKVEPSTEEADLPSLDDLFGGG